MCSPLSKPSTHSISATNQYSQLNICGSVHHAFSENNSEMQQLWFILRKCFTLHVSGDNPTHHQEYMCCIWPQVSRHTQLANLFVVKQFYLCGLCGVVGSHCLVVLRRAFQALLHTTHTDRTTLLRTNLLTKCACLPVAIYSTCTPDDGCDCHPKRVE